MLEVYMRVTNEPLINQTGSTPFLYRSLNFINIRFLRNKRVRIFAPLNRRPMPFSSDKYNLNIEALSLLVKTVQLLN